MAKLGKFQMYESKSWAGLTQENHLGAIFKKNPQLATPTMIQLLARYRGKNLEADLAKVGVKYFETSDEYYWELIGSSRRNLPLVEARDSGGVVTSAGVNVGVGGAQFELVFEEVWFADQNVIVGERPDLYPIRILAEPKYEGTNAVYTCELMGNVQGGIPAEELLPGKRFSAEFSPVEAELSRKAGDIKFTTPFAMRNEFSTLRIYHKVPGTMLNRVLKVGIPFVDTAGQKQVHTTWMYHVNYKIESQFSDEKSKALMYGRSNRNEAGRYFNIGKSGNVVRMGAGIREQMEVSNTFFYNKFDLKLIEDLLFGLSESKLEYAERRFVIKTGERGAVQFHKAAQDLVSGWNGFNYLRGSDHPGVIKQAESELHNNSLSFGYQFVEYQAPNGVIVRVEVDPMYDDRERNKLMHPNGGVAESYRYDIMYIGTAEEPNIQIAKVRGLEDLRGYSSGPFANPFTGQTSINYASTDEDSAEFHMKTTLGVCVYDPSRTASLIPTLLA